MKALADSTPPRSKIEIDWRTYCVSPLIIVQVWRMEYIQRELKLAFELEVPWGLK